tara:strand:+ start:708 stop:1403 length:696 start_codon:yes stop_codon:yes gene_type:complete
MNFPDLFDAFASRILPPHLTDAAVLQLRHEAYAEDLAPGDRLQLKDSEPHFVFIGSGAAKVSAYVSHEREQILAFHFAGDVIHIPARDRYNFSVTALNATEVLVMRTASFHEATPECCALLRYASDETVRALGRSREAAIVLGRKSAQERVAFFLLDMWERVPREDADSAIDLPMSRGEIAESLGLTIETVSRQFGEFKDMGLIETRGRSHLRVLDSEGLLRCTGQLAVAA